MIRAGPAGAGLRPRRRRLRSTLGGGVTAAAAVDAVRRGLRPLPAAASRGACAASPSRRTMAVVAVGSRVTKGSAGTPGGMSAGARGRRFASAPRSYSAP